MTGELERLARRFQDHEPGLLGASRSCAVLCPLAEGEDGLRLLFEVRSYQVSQAGEVCYQQKINVTSLHRAGNLDQSSARIVKSAGVFCGNTYDLKAMLFGKCFQSSLLNRQRMGIRICGPAIYPGSFRFHFDHLLVK